MLVEDGSHGLKTSFETMGDENEELNLKDKDDDRNHKFLEKDYS